MAVMLDPKEVQAHLHRLGYCNITGEQLKEFIKDLKKLIKYDQRLLCTCKGPAKVSESSYVETSPETVRTHDSTSLPSGNENSHVEIYRTDHSHDSTDQKYVTCTRSLAHDVPFDNSSSRSYVSSCCTPIPDTAVRSKKSTQFSKQKESQKTRSAEILQESVKPKTSFIRPWGIQPGQQLGASKRSDPVKLYHHYQDIWKQQKVPGEDNHSDLRWCIRERMLGEDPHPRHACSLPPSCKTCGDDWESRSCRDKSLKTDKTHRSRHKCSCCCSSHRKRRHKIVPNSQASSTRTLNRQRRKM